MSNINIILPDGSAKELPSNSTGLNLAESISGRLAQDAIGLIINGNLADVNTVLEDQQTVSIITKKSPESYEFLRHTTAHVLACAVQKLIPTAKIAIGPTIDNGFYYDFFIPDRTLSSDDLISIEAEMRNIINEDYKVQKTAVLDVNSISQEFIKDGEKFKAELLDKYKDDNPTQYGFYDADNNLIWQDLCRGPHLPNLKRIKAIKLLSVSSAYWHGDENLDSLQRIYGTAWWSNKEQEEYLNNLAEAEKRDHRKLSKQHELFSVHEAAGPGLIFWHPRLAFLRTRIENMWRELHEDANYEIVYSPHIARRELWEQSGHTDHYIDNMFKLEPIDSQEYLLKPMNCPFHVLMYKSRPHSYRELPVRFAEMGTVYRYERSGALHGLARVRGFTQDDAHVFCTVDQLVSEVCNIIDLINKIYSKFDLEYTAELSTRPDKKIGSDEIWDKAEQALEQALQSSNMNIVINEGDGAFYGPKIDFKLKDALGREWQGATIQVDFNLPKRFELNYQGADGQAHEPVMLHRAIFGSLERFTALLIEHYTGAFPLWLSQTQVHILPITDRTIKYSEEILEKLKKAGYKAKIDSRQEKVQAKIRDAQLAQTPYMLIIGDKEEENQTVAVRERRQGDIGVISLDEFIELLDQNNK